MAGESFQQLLELGASMEKGRTAIDSVSTSHDIQEAQAIEENTKNRKKADEYEKAVSAKIKGDQEARQRLIAQFGTDDPKRAAQIKATGAFDGDLEQRMKLDPDGTKASVDRAVALAGRGGVQDAPAEEHPIMEGVGAHGERYFTNRSEGELYATHAPVQGVQPGPVASGALKPFQDRGGGGDIGSGGGESPAEILFQGKLDQAQQIANAPDVKAAKDEKHAQVLETYGQSVLDLGHSEDATAARQKLQDDLMNGTLGKQGITPKEAQALDKVVLKRAKSTLEFAEPGVDRTFFMPWHKSSKQPGKAADIAEPSTVLNPGGAEPLSTTTKQANMMAQGEMDNHIQDTVGKELPRTSQYAMGASPQPQTTPRPQTPTTVGATFSNLASDDILAERRKKRQSESDYESTRGGPIDPAMELFGKF